MRFSQLRIIIVALSLSWAQFSVAEEERLLSAEVPDPEAVQAFREYWRSFELYEQKTRQDSKQLYQQQWQDIRSQYEENQKQLTSHQLGRLKDAAEKYKKHLQQYPNAENRPLVMLNLAQIQNLIAENLQKIDASSGAFNKQEALTILKDLEKGYPEFSYREEALYLRALILESLNKRDEALTVWQNLAVNARNKVHSIHANLAVGDYFFERDEPKQSVASYQRAEKIWQASDEKSDYELLRIQYRLSWAAYRAANLDLAVDTAAALLKPGRTAHSNETRLKIQQDAVELIGDSLYEADAFRKVKKTLAKRELEPYAAAVGLRLMNRYSANRIYEKAIEVGEYLTKEFPTAKEAPDFLMVAADAYRSAGSESKRALALERMAMMLPPESLWRTRFKDDFDAVKNMEQKSKVAGREAADYYYNYGVDSGNARSFVTAAGVYQLLIEQDPLSEETNNLRLKQAHCYFFSGKLSDAAAIYADLKTNYKLKPSTLEIAAYQLVLTNEKKWRKAFEEQVAKGNAPQKNPIVIEELKNLENSAEEFANRFPDQTRSVDLLLVVASANRDQDRFEEAKKLWERALVSEATPAQRAIAVRGLILASLKSGNNGDVVSLARRFLLLEDWQKLGSSLNGEVRGVLSAAAVNEADRLNKDGRVLEAGALLVKSAEEFKDLPNRDKIYRDGAYMMAIAGDWASAHAAAVGYQKEKLTQNIGDIIYLQARAEEFQIRFANAAKTYVQLAKKFPTHPRAMASLSRAQNLALAENDHDTAAEAAELYGDRASSRDEKLASYEQAVGYYDEAGESEKAIRAAQKRRAVAGAVSAEGMRSDLMVAETMYDGGNESKAINSMKALSQKAERQKEKMSPDVYAEVAGKTNFLLGEEARTQFEDFKISERGGSLIDRVAQKSKYFDVMAKRYDLAAASNHPEWGSRARYELAVAAESFADEMASLQVKPQGTQSDRSQKKYQDTAERLKKLAKRYYSTNLLARNRNPDLFKGNEWIDKSAVKLTGYGESDNRPKLEQSLPSAVHLDMPYQWSL
jgi:hypothetical protein